MKINHSSIFLSLFVSQCTAWGDSSAADFRRAIQEHKPALVAFIDPSALECWQFKPEWEALLESQSQRGLLSIDCSSERGLCDEFDVASYPAIRYFDKQGTSTPYRGPRTASAITSYLHRVSRPIITTLTSQKIDNFHFQSTDDRVVIAQLTPKDSHILTAFRIIASQFWDRASFATLQLDSETASGIRCYNNVDEQTFTLTDFTPVDAMSKLVESCLAPLVEDFSRRNEMKILQSGKSIVYFFAPTSTARQAFVDEIRPVAKMYKEYLVFVTVDAEEYGDMTAPLGLAPGVFPALAVQNPMFGQVFPLQQGAEISAESVGGFVMDIVQGKVKPWDGTRVQQQQQHEAGGSHDEL
ncbi:hypothetical protein F5Y16DRAFT_189620 [Xylariaceae sp. FL0255]|nr:hypothetical protein F5Y16DRAFT_189620 [Xylariaceae sp. FL0255]